MTPQYRIYIDESGDHTFDHCDEDSSRYLCLLGCVIEREHYRKSFQPDFEALKQRHFRYDPDDPLILVRSQIFSRNGAFWVLRDNQKRQNFNEDLLDFIQKHEFMIIAVVLDKKRHLENYGIRAYEPYNHSIHLMMERYCGWLQFNGKCGDSMAESRAGQDKYLKKAYRELFDGGTYYHDATQFQTTLTSAEIKLKGKGANIAGLQLADLLAHPCKEEILIGKGLMNDKRGAFTKKLRQLLEVKYHHHHQYQGRILGYGKIFIPRK
jgi:hypothetical protein